MELRRNGGTIAERPLLGFGVEKFWTLCRVILVLVPFHLTSEDVSGTIFPKNHSPTLHHSIFFGLLLLLLVLVVFLFLAPEEGEELIQLVVRQIVYGGGINFLHDDVKEALGQFDLVQRHEPQKNVEELVVGDAIPNTPKNAHP